MKKKFVEVSKKLKAEKNAKQVWRTERKKMLEVIIYFIFFLLICGTEIG